MFDSAIHDLTIQASRLRDRVSMFRDCGRDLEEFGLEGESWYHMTMEFDWMEDKSDKFDELTMKYWVEDWTAIGDES